MNTIFDALQEGESKKAEKNSFLEENGAKEMVLRKAW